MLFSKIKFYKRKSTSVLEDLSWSCCRPLNWVVVVVGDSFSLIFHSFGASQLLALVKISSSLSDFSSHAEGALLMRLCWILSDFLLLMEEASTACLTGELGGEQGIYHSATPLGGVAL